MSEAPPHGVLVLHEPDLDAARQALARGPVVIVSRRTSWLSDLAATSGQAWGLVPADAAPSAIEAAGAAVAAGLMVRPATRQEPGREVELPHRISSASGRPSVREPAPVEPLTPREREVLQQLAEGLSNRAIAQVLGISDHTVKFHLASIFGKLGAATRTEAVRAGLRQGLIVI